MNTTTGDRYRLADKTVWRVGYGAMQFAGDGVYGPPRDLHEALAVLRAAVDHIDTAQFYGPGVVNSLIREALFPYPDGLALVNCVAAGHDATPARVALAWLIAIADNVLLIPGRAVAATSPKTLPLVGCRWMTMTSPVSTQHSASRDVSLCPTHETRSASTTSGIPSPRRKI